MKLKSPGSDDLIDRIERMQRQIEEMGRGSRQNDRALIRMQATTTIGTGEQRLQDAWYGIPEVDTTGKPAQGLVGTIARVNVPVTGGLATYFEIPYAGRWRVCLNAAFSSPGGTSRNAACWLKVNEDISTAFSPTNTIAYTSQLVPTLPAATRMIAMNEKVFAKGDHVSFGFWCGNSGVILHGRSDRPGSATYAVIEYIGPL